MLHESLHDLTKVGQFTPEVFTKHLRKTPDWGKVPNNENCSHLVLYCCVYKQRNKNKSNNSQYRCTSYDSLYVHALCHKTYDCIVNKHIYCSLICKWMCIVKIYVYKRKNHDTCFLISILTNRLQVKINYSNNTK